MEDGSIPQVEITSCGTNGGALKGDGYYPSYIACHIYCNTLELESVGMTVPGKRRDARFPYLTQDGKDGDEYYGHVENMDHGATIGFKYFDCVNTSVIEIKARGWCDGEFVIMTKPDGDVLGSIPVKKSNEWKVYKGHVEIPDGEQALYFQYKGYGCASFGGFALKTS